jgi:hypothetical protein
MVHTYSQVNENTVGQPAFTGQPAKYLVRPPVYEFNATRELGQPLPRLCEDTGVRVNANHAQVWIRGKERGAVSAFAQRGVNENAPVACRSQMKQGFPQKRRRVPDKQFFHFT